MGMISRYRVQSKLYEVEHVGTNLEDSLIFLTEKGKKGVFKVGMSPICANWLGSLLCRISAFDKDGYRSWETLNKGVPVVAVASRNRGGEVLQVFFCKRKGERQARSICFPADTKRSGWENMGLGLLSLLMPSYLVRREERPRPAHQTQQAPVPVKMVKGGLNVRIINKTNFPSVEIRAEGAVANVQWWKYAMMCESSNPSIDWDWVRQKVCKRFEAAVVLRLLDSGEAMVFMSKESNMEEMRKLPPLEAEGGPIFFRRWGPMDGAFVNVISCEL
ncbi:hypothetical protein FRX31_031347 [Thalictrum thalictroides]|uniref:Uncharacterized protein n=1 Tax=Thalictrum thalictroides TaxID=46969 RepID=A0A7J6V266_THATH|nr:hypothetical protein FRX31_031347 [Thalictrum thalictroides]